MFKSKKFAQALKDEIYSMAYDAGLHNFEFSCKLRKGIFSTYVYIKNMTQEECTKDAAVNAASEMLLSETLEYLASKYNCTKFKFQTNYFVYSI